MTTTQENTSQIFNTQPTSTQSSHQQQQPIQNFSFNFNAQFINTFDQSDDDSYQALLYQSRRCHKCKKLGHVSRNCRSTEEIKCMYCLGPHLSDKCNDVLCQWCKEVGHNSKCCLTRWVKCYRCGKNGHVSKFCGKVIRANQNKQKSSLFFQYPQQDLKKIKCLVCNNQQNKQLCGHHNCHSYPDFIPQIYI